MKNLKKKLLRVILSLSIIFCVCSSRDVKAAEIVAQGTCGENVNWVITSDKILTITGKGEMTEASWRKSGADYEEVIISGGVTKICDKAFEEAHWVKKIVIEDGVKSIGSDAFSELDAIVFVPSSVENIEGYAFSGADQCLVVCAEEGTIAYEHGKRLSSTDSISPTEVKSGKLKGNFTWTWDATGTLTLNGSGPMPENMDFESFKYPIFHLVIKPGITSISDQAFQYCRKIESVSLPEGIKSIGASAFYNCNDLKEIILPNGLEEVCGNSFASCIAMEKVVIPEGIETISAWAFEACVRLKEITIPKGVKDVEMEAFLDCTNLRKIVFLTEDVSIHKNAFKGCPENMVIYCFEDSSVKSFAEKNNYKYQIVGVSDIFSDVSEGKWYVDAVQYVYDNGLMTGSNGLFKPNDNITRAQLITTLYRLAGEPEVTDFRAVQDFVDVPERKYYTDAVCWAYNEGIATGNAGKFDPTGKLTRQQMAAFFFRYAKVAGFDTNTRGSLSSMVNADKVSGYATDAVEWAVGTGLISGSEVTDVNGNKVKDLNPRGNTTRAQVATILQRFCEKYQ